MDDEPIQMVEDEQEKAEDDVSNQQSENDNRYNLLSTLSTEHCGGRRTRFGCRISVAHES